MLSERPGSRPKLLFLVTEDWYFCSHRLPIARAARDAGFAVTVATRVTDHGEQICAEGFDLVPLSLSRRASTNPLRELAALIEIAHVYRRMAPDIVHHVGIKPALIGSLAARLAGGPRQVNAIAGLGYVFSSSALKARLLRPFIALGFRLLLNGARSRVIVQNPDDARLLTARGLVAPNRLTLIKGSGVDLAHFHPAPEPATDAAPPVAALVSRMIWDKGVGVLVEAGRILKTRGVALRIVLAGQPDAENPASIPTEQLRAWHDEGIVEWLGFCDDVAGLWARSQIAVLPSWYGEGVPKSLLEAAACGRPMIAADGPGLREVVQDGVTGLLVPPRDPVALANALQRLAEDKMLRDTLGQAARSLAEREFGEGVVVSRTLELYRTLLKAGQSG